MKKLSFIFIMIATLGACSQVGEQDATQAFITKLGSDTLAVENFQKTDSSLTAQVIMRSPEVSLISYYLLLDNEGGIDRFVQTEYSPQTGFSGEGAVSKTITRLNDSLMVKEFDDQEIETNSYMAPYEEGVIPFIDLVHWPFELALNEARETGQDSVTQPFLSGNRILDFTIASISQDSMTLRHPFRGVMGIQTNYNGDLLYLDAGLTTRKLKVYREDEVDMQLLTDQYAESPIGALSGAVSAEYSIHNADIRLEYGSPKKRDRQLFGGIVAWGERWRTGANRATHFYTSKELQFGELKVPAGEYTLFTIPQPEGGTLIINKQTGQNGTSYDESQDLGRIPMSIGQSDELVESFTISVSEREEGGTLNLIWGNTVFSADFAVN